MSAEEIAAGLCDQGTNHDSFEGPDMSGSDRASHYLTIPTLPEKPHDRS